MVKKANAVLTTALMFGIYTPGWVSADDAHMVVIEKRDISGQVFKRLGLPNQDYCWQQCLKEERCTGTRWGVVAGETAGQCQLLSGELTFREPREIKTEDGQSIVVSASRKEPVDAKQKI